MKIARPRHLAPGDTVLLTSVSSPVPTVEHLQRMTSCLQSFGLKVTHSEHVLARNGYLAGSLEDRAADLNAGLADNSIKAVFFAWGGKGANQLLPLIDYQEFAARPKIVLGLSDPAAIVNALYAKTGRVTFHGPTGVNFADPAGLAPYTRTSFQKALFSTEVLGEISAHSQWEVLRPGFGRGPLVGGHLTTVQTLLGTPYEPSWRRAVFFWEEVGKTARQIEHALTHFRLRGGPGRDIRDDCRPSARLRGRGNRR